MTRDIPGSMTAIAIEGGKGPVTALTPVQMPIPEPGADEILIEIHAAGINRPDLFQRMGHYPPPPGAPDTLGLEVAGIVVKAAGRWRVGDKVCALLGGGGYAQYARCDARHALPIPGDLSFEEAAALPETIFTVYANVFEQGALTAGETLMVYGANSGIGVTCIQMAKAAGAKVIATARGKEKTQCALDLGADIAVDVSKEDFAEIAIQEGGVDVILDMIGGDYFAKGLSALNIGGRILFIAALGGTKVTLPILSVMQKRAIVTGSTLRARTAEEKAHLATEIEHLVWPWINAGKLRLPVDKTFALEDAASAHAYMESGSHIGKIVLTTGK